MTKDIRVRYAPSPTGYLHIGGARTALFNYLFAKHHNGKFIVRIEDTDVERNIKGGEASQLDNLRWLGILPDESIDIGGPYTPYRQMERLDIYEKHAKDLLAKGKAYKCFCSSEKLEASREAQKEAGIAAPHYDGTCKYLTAEQVAVKEAANEAFTIRMAVPENRTFTFDDLVRGPVSFESKDIGDWVIVKGNGIPTYNYAVALDDYYMEMTHVFRGEEHLSNTPKQIMIFEAFGWIPPTYGHMTLIVNENRKKLSKRDETIVQFVSQYRELGYLPEAMFNFFALLGWSPTGEEEIFSHEELVAQFDVNRLTKSVSMFDKKKLAWMNNQYMKKLEQEDFTAFVIPFLQKATRLPEKLSEGEYTWAKELVLLYQEQLTYGAEIVSLTEMFFTDELIYEPAILTSLQQEAVQQVLHSFKNQLKGVETLEVPTIKTAIKAVQKDTGVKGKGLFMPIRLALTGQEHGPELGEVLALIGKDKLMKRLNYLLDSVKQA